MWTLLSWPRDLGLFILLTLVVTSTVIWLSTGITTSLCRHASAAARHRLWCLSMLAVLITPLLVVLELPLPRWTTWDCHSGTTVMQPKTDSREDARPQIPLENRSQASPSSELEIIRNDLPSALPIFPKDVVYGMISIQFILSLVAWTWLFGIVVSGLLLIESIHRVAVWRNHGIPVESGPHFATCADLCRQLKISSPVKLVLSPETMVPCVSGIWRPIIHLPLGYGKWAHEQANSVLMHELIHVQRSDILWQMVARFCLIPFWFNPLGWMALQRLRIACEHACDDAVLLKGESPFRYANHLVELAKWSQGMRMPPHTVALVSRSTIEQRVISILNPRVSRQALGYGQSSALAIWIAAITLSIVASFPTQSESNSSLIPVTDSPVPVERPHAEVQREAEPIQSVLNVPREVALEGQNRSGERVDEMRPSDSFLSDLDKAIETTSGRMLVANVHSPWQIFQSVLALRQSTTLRLDGKIVNAIEWISTSEPQFDEQPWLLLTPHGAKFHPFTRIYAFEGHPAQFLAYLSESNLPLNHALHVEGKLMTLNDLVTNTMKEVNLKEEVTWVLWALQHFLEPDAVWSNQANETWSIERLVRLESNRPVIGAPNGGNDQLFALTRARDKYLRSGRQLRGPWLQADQKIRQHIEIARSLQSSDGSFSSDFYKGPGTTTDINRRINATGHTMEFLAVSLPKERLHEPWVKTAVKVLSEELIVHRTAQIDCGPLFHSLNALIIYRDRLRELQSH